jgi:large subunit ribosomal protein L31
MSITMPKMIDVLRRQATHWPLNRLAQNASRLIPRWKHGARSRLTPRWNRLPIAGCCGSGLQCWSFPGLAEPAMKSDVHPQYQQVVFHDMTANFAFLTRSTMTSKEKVKWEDGNEYPLIKVEISSASHPFYTGQHKIVDSAGRVDKFRRRYAAAKK